MGTRRSRHNKGRKPFYKDHREVAAHLLKHPRFPCLTGRRGDDTNSDNGWYNTRSWWSDADKLALGILCEADAPIDGAADALGRKPCSIAHYARDRGLVLPPEWSHLIAPKCIRRSAPPKEAVLAYPFIRSQRDEHAQVLAINNLIPKTIPDHMRADMCQEILLAILEGRTSIEALEAKKATATYYIKKFYHDNYEQGGHAISFDAATTEDWQDAGAAVAAKQWHREQFNDRTRYTDQLRTFTPPTQFEAAWNDQVGRAVIRAQELGRFLSHEEMAELMEEQ